MSSPVFHIRSFWVLSLRTCFAAATGCLQFPVKPENRRLDGVVHLLVLQVISLARQEVQDVRFPGRAVQAVAESWALWGVVFLQLIQTAFCNAQTL